MGRWRALSAAVVVAWSAHGLACNSVFGIKEKELGEAGVEAPGFDLNVSKALVRLVRGASATVDVTVTRHGGFGGAVTVFVNTPPESGVTVDLLALGPSQTTGTLTLYASNDAVLGASTPLSLLGTSGAISSRAVSLDLIVQGPSGTRDVGFGSSGRVPLPMRSVGRGGLKIDGGKRIVVCGNAPTNTSKNAIALARLTGADPTAGMPDTTFGSGGIALSTRAQGADDSCEAMFVRAGGGINLTGSAGLADAGTRDLMVARYTPMGIPDQNTGDGGYVTTPFGTSVSEGLALLSTANDTFVAGGAGPGGAVFVRYQHWGQLDVSFGVDGTGIVSVGDNGDGGGSGSNGNGASSVRWLAQQSAGIVAAIQSSSVRVMRLTTAGEPDPQFAGGGVAVLQPQQYASSSAAAVLVLPDDSVVVAGVAGTAADGSGTTDFVVARLTTAGQLDPSFGAGGWGFAHFGAGPSVVASAALQDDGSIVIAGQTPSADAAGTPTASIVRFHANGTFDTAFGTMGRQMLAPGLAQAVAIDDLGRLVVATIESSGAVGDTEVFLYRLWP
jgi:uncharacterized delta-60 repeat protein